MKLKQLVKYLDEYFNLEAFCAADPSQNGLQVESCEEVVTVATAVDACMDAFHGANDAQAQMLFVHHGIFWNKSQPITGTHGERIRYLIQHGISVYAVHLPLDMHEEVGNNVGLANILGLKIQKPFGNYHNLKIGFQAVPSAPVLREDVVKKLDDLLNTKSQVLPFGPQKIKRIGIVSGGGAFEIDLAAKKKLDLLITGEIGHANYHQAKELRINVIASGHYATETLGVKTLGKHLQEKFGIKHLFLDHPTGY